MKKIEKELYDQYLRKLQIIRESEGVNPFETPEEKAIRIERAKHDFAYCVQYYFSHYTGSDTPDFHEELSRRVARNPNITELVRWGRGLAKSVLCDIFIPYWLWLRGEPVYLVLIGENETKAIQLLSDIQAEFEANPRILHDFGDMRLMGSWADGFFVTKNNFIGQALGLRQSTRGLRVRNQRPTICVVDDIDTRESVKNQKRCTENADWIVRELLGTMDGAYRRALVPNNYFAPVTTQEVLRVKYNWSVHRVDACPGAERKPRWSSKYPEDYYRTMETTIGTLALDAEYNNTPHIEGSIFTHELIQWGQCPRRDTFDAIIGYWDVAYAGTSTADFNAIRVMGFKDGRFWHLRTYCRQSKMRDAIRWMFECEAAFPESAMIHWWFESQFWNDALRMELNAVEKEYGRTLNISKGDRPSGKKYDRILRLHPHYQSGRIWYDEREKGSTDMQTAIAQLMGIEPGYRGHDDAPDAEAECVHMLERQVDTDAALPLIGKRDTQSGLY